MDLILTVTAGPDGANMLNHTKAFDQNGGTVGRADSNNWVLPDPTRVVSSRHAVITHNGSGFELQDASTNGTYFNDNDTPIGSGNTQPLSDGDIVVLGDYKLKVTIKTPKPAAGLATGLESADFLDNGDKTTFSATSMAKMQSQSEAKELDGWLEADKPAAPAPAQGGDDWGFLNESSNSDPLATSNIDPFSNSPAHNPLENDFGISKADPFAATGNPLGGFSQPAGSANINADPLAAFGAPKTSDAATGADPLAALNQAQGQVQPQSADWDDGEDWWKNGAEADHVPADQQIMQSPTPVQPEPTPVVTPPVPSPEVIEPNPFAASQKAVQEQSNNHDALINTPPQPQAAAQMVASPSAIPQTPPQQPPAPDAWGQAQVTPQPAQPPSQPLTQQPVAQSAPASGIDATSLATALGLNLLQAQQLQQLIPESADIINETAARLIDLLRARNSIKNELRVQRTMIQTADNNPLKFSASATDALNAMFSANSGSGNSAFMSPREAVSDSFDDLSDHQVAVLSGMRAAYEAMFEQFSPEKIERRVNNSGGLLSSKSAKNWEGYKNLYADLRRDPDSTYGKLFGEEFASSYEKQLSELKNARAMRQSNL